ncbi:cbb3-type cytochrome oxidase assembly protein CcoS [Marinobacter sp. CHS3-4]|uniref:cbb3-type cytochrome oxidase assembly protein CcoS n=1 Tax=Marinobacter sp. CHS3-4 TaxID=3045174 RepID=UPI0024B58CAF|nr:cbb3-type cytochrome oxidase assembly protein CcoS [Marinobacter sp. CHS3-4]MDI9245723.1 cbb3-type cytochrome oxidase assembly protein CcoS [Marinobacter sp. CHS3-4]
MKIVMILVPIMLILVALGIVLFSWAVRNGQYDDLEGPAHRILYDDDEDRIPEEAKQHEQKTASMENDSSHRSDKDRPPS